MDKAGRVALHQLNIAEAELAVLKQEAVIRRLHSTDEPTAEAVAKLTQLHKTAADLSGCDPFAIANGSST